MNADCTSTAVQRLSRLSIQTTPTADTDLLTTAELAAWLGVTKAWVELGRVKNFGPPYLRLSAQMIRYRRSEVKAWLQERSFRHTGQYAAAEQS